MTFNYELASKIITKITHHPKKWDQSNWATKMTGCGSAYCFAGYVVLETGYKIDWKAGYSSSAGRRFTEYCTKDGEIYLIREVAQEELGLTRYQANKLFFPGNDRNALRALIQQFHEADKYSDLSPILREP